MNSQRLRALRRLLAGQGCTHVLVSDPVDVRYISGFDSSNVFLLVSARALQLCTDFRYLAAARRFCAKRRGWSVVEIKENTFGFLSRLLPRGSRLGVQSASLTVERFDRIRRILKQVPLVKLSDAISALSLAKTGREVALMRRCARIGDQALRRTIGSLRPGMREREVAALLEEHCRDLGSSGPSFETIVLFGPRTALPHGRPGNRRLKPGDFVLFDFGCTRAGMCSDMTRTIVAGRASRRQREIYDVVRQAQAAARAGIRPGLACAEADRIARDIIGKAGFGRFFGHATGHGVGLRIHEAPRLGSSSKEKLAAGMVVTVEPGIYINGFGGVRIEDMVHLTSRRPEVMTHFPRSLIERDL